MVVYFFLILSIPDSELKSFHFCGVLLAVIAGSRNVFLDYLLVTWKKQ